MFPSPEAHTRDIWRMLAFIGRYGHQSVLEALSMPVNELRVLGDEVASLLGEEKKGLPSEED